MAGSMVAASRVGSRRVLFEPEELCAERQGGLWHVRSEHSCNGNMHGCSCSWKPLSVCHVAGGYALMLNQLLLRVNGKADSNYTGPILPGGACSPCLSLLILYSLPHRAVNALVKLFFPVLVETRLQRYSRQLVGAGPALGHLFNLFWQSLILHGPGCLLVPFTLNLTLPVCV